MLLVLQLLPLPDATGSDDELPELQAPEGAAPAGKQPGALDHLLIRPAQCLMRPVCQRQRFRQLAVAFGLIERVRIAEGIALCVRVEAAGGALSFQDLRHLAALQARGLSDGTEGLISRREAPHGGGLVAPAVGELHAAAVAPIPQVLRHGATDEGHHSGAQRIGPAGGDVDPLGVVAAAAVQQALHRDQIQVIEAHLGAARQAVCHGPGQA